VNGEIGALDLATEPEDGVAQLDEFRTHYEMYAPMVYRRCKSLLGNEDDALDAMQAVFVRLLEKRPEIKDPPAFLYKAATHTCLNLIRSDKRYRDRIANKTLVEIAQSEDQRWLSARSSLAALFGAASESTRLMAVMHYVDGMTLEQVAQATDMSVSGVRKRLRKLRARLQFLEAGHTT
jgi:RNA polymerase sigma-70 factor (ECF subfamily)